MDGITFGIFDNGVLLGITYFGINLDKKLGGSGRIGGIIGACLGNTLSDFFGALADPSMRPMALGIVIGCLIPMIAIPIIELVRYKNAN